MGVTTTLQYRRILLNRSLATGGILSVDTALALASRGVRAWRIVVAHNAKCPTDLSFCAAVIVQTTIFYAVLTSVEQEVRVQSLFHHMYTSRVFNEAEMRLRKLMRPHQLAL
jgi:hypothetical protein